MPDSKQSDNHQLFTFFRSRIRKLGAESAAKYRRTLTELDCFLTGHSLRLCKLSDAMAADWCIDLLRGGLSKTTVVRHLNILSSLLRSAAKAGLAEPTEIPRKLARQLEADTTPLPILLTDKGFNTLLGKLRTALRQETSSVTDPAADLLILSIITGQPVTRLALLKKNDPQTEELQANITARKLIARNEEPARHYIFDLRQSYRTPAQLRGDIADKLREYLRPLPFGEDLNPDALSASAQGACMIHCGATASEVLAAVNGPMPQLLPAWCKAAETAPQWQHTALGLLLSATPKWYALRLRKSIDYDALRTRLGEIEGQRPELYYPCEEIRKKVGKRTVVEDQPYIKGTVFFRTSPENVAGLMRQIGDLAWCYRWLAEANAPYAAIPAADMERFQRAIGVFAPSTEIHPLGGLTPKPGERVIILAPGYACHPAEVTEVLAPDSAGSVIIRVRLTTDQGYEWRLTLPAPQLAPTEHPISFNA